MALAATVMVGCRKGEPAETQKTALLPFDNLTGDPSLEWMRTALPAIASEQLTGLKTTLPVTATSIQDAIAAGATRFVWGYFERRDGAVQVRVSIEDAATRKMSANLAMNGPLLKVGDELAKRLDAGAKPFPTSDAGAVEAWAKGEFERAITIDPQFGAAWLGWVQQLMAMQNAPRALEIANRALMQESLRPPVDKAQIQVLAAALRGDEDGRAIALEQLAKMAGNDPAVLTSQAEAEMQARRFGQAADAYRQLAQLQPGKADWLNQLGYAYALAGNVDQARKAFVEYRKMPGQEPNAIDSLGEALFMNGQFGEAEKLFLEAQAKAPAMLEGSDLAKAAYARWLGGDLPGADRLFGQYLEYRKQQHDPVVTWREAAWLYATGRRDQALSKLNEVTGGPPDLVPRQKAVWQNPDQGFPQDPKILKPVYDRTQPTADGLIRVFYAESLVKAGRADQAKELMRRWPLPDATGEPWVVTLMYPKYLELRERLK